MIFIIIMNLNNVLFYDRVNKKINQGQAGMTNGIGLVSLCINSERY